MYELIDSKKKTKQAQRNFILISKLVQVCKLQKLKL